MLLCPSCQSGAEAAITETTPSCVQGHKFKIPHPSVVRRRRIGWDQEQRTRNYLSELYRQTNKGREGYGEGVERVGGAQEDMVVNCGDVKNISCDRSWSVPASLWSHLLDTDVTSQHPTERPSSTLRSYACYLGYCVATETEQQSSSNERCSCLNPPHPRPPTISCLTLASAVLLSTPCCYPIMSLISQYISVVVDEGGWRRWCC